MQEADLGFARLATDSRSSRHGSSQGHASLKSVVGSAILRRTGLPEKDGSICSYCFLHRSITAKARPSRRRGQLPPLCRSSQVLHISRSANIKSLRFWTRVPELGSWQESVEAQNRLIAEAPSADLAYGAHCLLMSEADFWLTDRRQRKRLRLFPHSFACGDLSSADRPVCAATCACV